MKKLALLLAILLLLTALTACNNTTEQETASTPIEQFEYTTLPNENAISIKKYLGSDQTVVIPSEIEGMPVTFIGTKAFADNSSVVEIYIPATVTVVTEWSFENCTKLQRIIFEGDAPEKFDTSDGGRTLGHYVVYFSKDAKGIPENLEQGAFWHEHYALLRDDATFDMPYASPIEGEESMTKDQLTALIEKLPSEKYLEYPCLQSKPVSATLYIDGKETAIDPNDPRLVKMMNLFWNTTYHNQYSLTQGVYNSDYLAEFEAAPTRLVLTYDAPIYEGERGQTRDGFDTIIVNTEFFVCIKHDIPSAGYPSTAYGRWPYWGNYNWLSLFGFQ